MGLDGVSVLTFYMGRKKKDLPPTRTTQQAALVSSYRIQFIVGYTAALHCLTRFTGQRVGTTSTGGNEIWGEM